MLNNYVHDLLVVDHNVDANLEDDLCDVSDIVGPEVVVSHLLVFHLNLIDLLLAIQLYPGAGDGGPICHIPLKKWNMAYMLNCLHLMHIEINI